MNKQLNNISLRQALILFIIATGSPTTRIMPIFAIEKAGQAAWLTPIPAIPIIIIYFLMYKKVFTIYENISFVEIMEKIFGRILGKALGIMYFIYITILNAFYLRFYSERLRTSLSIYTSYIIYAGIMLTFISYILKYDLPIIARAAEIMMWFAIMPYFLVNIVMLPNVNVSNFYPITYKDILPSLDGGISIISIWSYITFIFMFSDRISNKKYIFKTGVQTLIVDLVIILFAICMPLGIFGTASKVLAYPYISSVQTVSLFNTIERIEAFVISIWIITDFILILIFIFSGLHILKSIFKLSDSKPLINIYIILIFFLTIYFAKNVYELQTISSNVIIYSNIIMGLVIPFSMFFVGKLRRKF